MIKPMSKPTPIRRARSVVTPKRDPNMDTIAQTIDTMEGKNNPLKRDLPAMDQGQAMQSLILVTSKEPCYLCHGVPHAVKIYRVPNGLNILGQRLILYTLCFDCIADVTSKGKVEYKLVKHLQTENGMAN